MTLEEDEAELEDILCLGSASPPWAPACVVTALVGVFQSEDDYEDGGADQFVWNHGPEVARTIGQAWREIGAVENGELLLELAAALDAFRAAHEGQALEPVRAFLAYRAQVGGPEFGRPEPKAEVGEAVLEWALEHVDAFGPGAHQ